MQIATILLQRSLAGIKWENVINGHDSVPGTWEQAVIVIILPTRMTAPWRQRPVLTHLYVPSFEGNASWTVALSNSTACTKEAGVSSWEVLQAGRVMDSYCIIKKESSLSSLFYGGGINWKPGGTKSLSPVTQGNIELKVACWGHKLYPTPPGTPFLRNPAESLSLFLLFAKW